MPPSEAPGYRVPPPQNAAPLLRVWQVEPAAIQFLTSLVEAADGIGLVRTLDERRGLIECWIMPDFVTEFEQIIAATAAQYGVQEIGEEFE